MTRTLTATCGATLIGLLLTGGIALAGSIEISPSVKGADLETAKKLKTALEGSLKQCQACQVKIDVKNGVADLSGKVPPEFAQSVKRIGPVPGLQSVKTVNIKTESAGFMGNVNADASQKGTPGMPGGSVASDKGPGEVQVSEHVARQGADRKAPGTMPGPK
jgi:hypothetical protein